MNTKGPQASITFDDLDLLPEILSAVKKHGYETPSPIQAAAIPAVLAGSDVMGAAQTGTGKTAGFTLPILQRLSSGQRARGNHVRALILTPTRELAAQIGQSIITYGQNLPLKSTVVFGGVGINPQMMKLRKGVDLLVATPGRLLDLYSQNAVRFNDLEVLVLDEADRMLDMGFIHDIRKILRVLPEKRQTLMFSATFSEEIRTLAKGLVKQPVEISVTPRNTTVASVDQWICPVDKKQKSALLSHLIIDNNWSQVLVFSRTKHGANRLAQYLEKNGIDSAAIHGNKSQGARTKALADFKANKTQVLVATDIAARGLDINQLPIVVNFDLPNVPEDYVHRIGRTGRAGAVGQAISLVSADEAKQLQDIESLIKRALPRQQVDGFEPGHDVPATRPQVTKPKRNKNRSAKNNSNRTRSGGNQANSSNGKTGGGGKKIHSSKSATGKNSRKSRPRRPKAPRSA